MAKPSPTTPLPQIVVDDLDSAMVVLDACWHWKATRLNTRDQPRRYEITVTHGGRRVVASRRTFDETAVVAIARLRAALLDPDSPRGEATNYQDPDGHPILKLAR